MCAETFASRKPVSSLYVHVPFCRGRCAYCDFFSTVTDRCDEMEAWCGGVCRELERASEESVRAGVSIAPLETLYFGGGTPTAVPVSLIARVIGRARSLFSLSHDCEITVEANPESFLNPALCRGTLSDMSDAPSAAFREREGRRDPNRDRRRSSACGAARAANDLDTRCGRMLRAAGVTRISLGIQSVTGPLLARAGRLYTADEACRALFAASDAGFRHISCDFITGLPGQTLADIDRVLAMMRESPCDHVSCYALSVVPGTRFGALFRRDPALFPDDGAERAMTRRMIDGLAALGFSHYEISNFARPGAESRHNTVYWNADPYLAAGPSASSYLGGIRRTHPASMDAWLRHVGADHGGPYGAAIVDEIVDESSARVETMILGLRMMRGVPRVTFRRRHGVDYEDVFEEPLRSLTEDGLIVRDDAGVRLTAKGLDFVDAAARAFL